MDRFPISPEAWQQGLTLEAFVDSMQRHQAATRRRLAHIRLPVADQQAFA